jgi:hypothetical protein
VRAERAHQGVELVVEAHHGGAEAALEDAPDRLQAGLDVRDLEAAEHPQLGRGRDAEARGRDHAERALAAEHELGPRRAAQRAVGAVGLDDLAAAGDQRQPGDAILDLAVLRGQLPGGAGREPPADGGAVDRGREVAEGVAAPLELALEPLSGQAGVDVAQELGVADRAQLLHALGVDRDAAVERDRAAAHAGAAAVRDDRDLELARELHDRGDLAHVLGPHHRVRPVRRRDPLAVREQEPRPHVARVGVEIDAAQGHPPRPDDRFEIALQAIRIDRGVHGATLRRAPATRNARRISSATARGTGCRSASAGWP